MTKTRPVRGGIFLPALLCTALWGSAIPAVKAGYDLFSIAGEDAAAKLFFAGMRFTIAGLLVLALVLRSLTADKKHCALQWLLACLITAVAGMNGVKQLMVFHAPLCLAAAHGIP